MPMSFLSAVRAATAFLQFLDGNARSALPLSVTLPAVGARRMSRSAASRLHELAARRVLAVGCDRPLQGLVLGPGLALGVGERDK
eukprot:11225273-Heterocapsa_arctica.AAC.1